jgi:DNA invertase Pin-like site-specific DNA recombinase
MKPAYLLARVSTVKASQDASPEGQLAALRNYCQRQGWQIYEEGTERVSGAKGEASRPVLAAAMQAARAGKIGTIAVTRIDRLGRSLTNLLDTAGELRRLGVELTILDLGLDTSTPTGRLVFAVLAALAEFQRDLYGAAALAGQARARAAGKVCHRPPEPVPAHTVAAALAQRAATPGISWRQLSDLLARHPEDRQPGRVIKSTGVLRPARPWSPATLRRAVLAAVQKPPADFGCHRAPDPSISTRPIKS